MKSMLSKKHLNEIQEKLVVMTVKRKWMKGITMARQQKTVEQEKVEIQIKRQIKKKRKII